MWNIFRDRKPTYFYAIGKKVCQSSTQTACESDLYIFFVFQREEEYFVCLHSH